MFNIFNKRKEANLNNKIEEISSPCNGKVVQIENIPDQIFSELMMGDGIGIEPLDGGIYSPVDGEILQIFGTKHAIVIRSNLGTDILLHIGLDTVSLDGVPFDIKVGLGKKVKSGELIMKVDIEYIKSKGLQTVIPIILINDENSKERTIVNKTKELEVCTGDNLMQVK